MCFLWDKTFSERWEKIENECHHQEGVWQTRTLLQFVTIWWLTIASSLMKLLLNLRSLWQYAKKSFMMSLGTAKCQLVGFCSFSQGTKEMMLVSWHLPMATELVWDQGEPFSNHLFITIFVTVKFRLWQSGSS